MVYAKDLCTKMNTSSTKAVKFEAPILQTERLHLRAWQEDDAAAIPELLDDPDVSSKLSSVPHPYTIMDAMDWIEQQPGFVDRQEGIHLGAFKSSSGCLTGSVGLTKTSFGESTWELGYWFGKTFWGQGYATEAVGALLDWAKPQYWADRFYAGFLNDNLTSARVLEKLGFTHFYDSSCHITSLQKSLPARRMIWPANAQTDDIIAALDGASNSGACT